MNFCFCLIILKYLIYKVNSINVNFAVKEIFPIGQTKFMLR